MTPINLTQLRSFILVAETSNLTTAARALQLTQPAVSQHLRSLEEYLGLSLFDRSRRRLVLTPAGQVLLRRGRELLALAQRTLEDVQRVGANAVLRIAASSIPGECLLPEILRRFQDVHTGIRVQLVIGDTRVAIERLARGEADLAVVGALPEPPKPWQTHAFREDRLSLLVPPNHPWAASPAVPPQSLAGEPLVWREPGSGTRRTAETALASQGVRVEDLTIVCTVDSNEACISAVSAGLGVTMLSHLAAANAIAEGKVVEVPLENLDIQRSFHLLLPPEPTSAAQEFLEYLSTEHAIL